MTRSDARKRHNQPTPEPAERVGALSNGQAATLAALTAGWFVDHAELDRDHFLTLAAEVEALS